METAPKSRIGKICAEVLVGLRIISMERNPLCGLPPNEKYKRGGTWRQAGTAGTRAKAIADLRSSSDLTACFARFLEFAKMPRMADMSVTIVGVVFQNPVLAASGTFGYESEKRFSATCSAPMWRRFRVRIPRAPSGR